VDIQGNPTTNVHCGQNKILNYEVHSRIISDCTNTLVFAKPREAVY